MYPSTVIYLTKLYKRLLAILLFVVVVLQKGSKVSVWLQVEVVEVGWLQVEQCRQSSKGRRLAAGGSSKISVNCGQSSNG